MMGLSRSLRDVSKRWGSSLDGLFARLLRRPVFVVGFNNSGKSTLVKGLLQQPGLTPFPGEGNDDLWFPNFYPWWELEVKAPPLWYDPDAFVAAVLESRSDGFLEARAQLGLYQMLRSPAKRVVNDSGMLAALLPDITSTFSDALFIHMVRDGRVVTHLAAEKALSRIEQHPEKYERAGCPTDEVGVLEAHARYWCWILERVAAASERDPKTTMQVRYEDWCCDPDQAVEEIGSFLGLSRIRALNWSPPVRNLNQEALEGVSAGRIAKVEMIQRRHLASLGYSVGPAETHAS
jgi:hypothetical protein